MLRKILFATALMILSATAGAAAPAPVATGPTLSVGKGTVMVSNGSQFVTAKQGQVLKPGDRVMVLQGASATVNYGNGRASALPPGSLSDIGSSNAFSGVTNNKKFGPMYAQAVGYTDENQCRDRDGHPLLDSNGHERTCCRDRDGHTFLDSDGHEHTCCRDRDGRPLLDRDGHPLLDRDGHPLLHNDGHDPLCVGYYTGEEHFFAVAGTAAVIVLALIGISSDGSNDHPISAP